MKRQHKTTRQPSGTDVPSVETAPTSHAGVEFCERRPVVPRDDPRPPADPNEPAPTCYDCVYALWDRNHWLSGLGVSWAIRPTFASQPEALGTMREIPRTGRCRNFRWKQETRGRMTPPPPPSPDVAYIPLTKRKFALVDKADYERLVKYKWFVMDGRKGAFYAGRKEGCRIVTMHNEIMQAPPGMVVHHINHNGLDNRRCNLQICTPQGKFAHTASSAPRPPASSACIVMESCWRALVQSKDEVLYEEVFDDKIEVAKARDDKAVEFFGESARVNFPDRHLQTPPALPQPRQSQITSRQEAHVVAKEGADNR